MRLYRRATPSEQLVSVSSAASVHPHSIEAQPARDQIEALAVPAPRRAACPMSLTCPRAATACTVRTSCGNEWSNGAGQQMACSMRLISTDDGRSRVRFAARWSFRFCSLSASSCFVHQEAQFFIRRCRVCSSLTARGAAWAIRRSFGRNIAIQRCQIHKARNIMERLPKPPHTSVRRALRQAWELTYAA